LRPFREEEGKKGRKRKSPNQRKRNGRALAFLQILSILLYFSYIFLSAFSKGKKRGERKKSRPRHIVWGGLLHAFFREDTRDPLKGKGGRGRKKRMEKKRAE